MWHVYVIIHLHNIITKVFFLNILLTMNNDDDDDDPFDDDRQRAVYETDESGPAYVFPDPQRSLRQQAARHQQFRLPPPKRAPVARPPQARQQPQIEDDDDEDFDEPQRDAQPPQYMFDIEIIDDDPESVNPYAMRLRRHPPFDVQQQDHLHDQLRMPRVPQRIMPQAPAIVRPPQVRVPPAYQGQINPAVQRVPHRAFEHEQEPHVLPVGPRRRARDRRPDPHGRVRNGNNVLLRARNWIVTLRTMRPPRDHTGEQTPNGATLDYQCGQMEWGRTPGVNHNGAHWQGYLEFSADVTAIDIIDLFQWPTGDAHLEPRYGSQDDAINYTKKEDTRNEDFEWEEFGTKHTPDAVGAMQQLQRAIVGGARMNQFLHDNNLFSLALRCHKGVERFIQEVENTDESNMKPRPVKVIVYYGEPRSGKTGTVYRRHDRKEIFKKGRESSQHWTKYDGHPVLLIDEFGGDDCPINIGMAQEVLDQWPLELKIMYGTKPAKWNTVYLCSNLPPSQWFSRAPPQIRQSIQERIHEVWRFEKNSVFLEKGEGKYPPIPDPTILPPPSIITHAAPAVPVPVVAPVVVAPAAPPPQRFPLMSEELQETIRKILEKNPINTSPENLLRMLSS